MVKDVERNRAKGRKARTQTTAQASTHESAQAEEQTSAGTETSAGDYAEVPTRKKGYCLGFIFSPYELARMEAAGYRAIDYMCKRKDGFKIQKQNELLLLRAEDAEEEDASTSDGNEVEEEKVEKEGKEGNEADKQFNACSQGDCERAK
jgi:hypothetical protein